METALEIDGLAVAVSPPQPDLLDLARALLGRGPIPPRDWLFQDGFTGPRVSVACRPPIAATLEDELVDLVSSDAVDDEPLADLVTEEVGPGVFRVAATGSATCAASRSSRARASRRRRWTETAKGTTPWVDEGSLGRVVAGLDGRIWLFWEDRFLRLGDEATHHWSEDQVPSDQDDLEVAPDGTVWQASPYGSQRSPRARARVERYIDQLRAHPDAFAARPGCLTDTGWVSESDGALRAYRDGQWQVALDAPSEPIRQVEIAGDDAIWALWSEPSQVGHMGPQAARLGADGWRLAVLLDEPVDFAGELAALEDGSLLMRARGRSAGLWRLGETRGDEPGQWQPLADHRGLGDVVMSPDGSVWGKVTRNSIVRLAQEGWQEWDLGRMTDPDAPRFLGGGGPLAAGQDGALWLQARPTRAAQGCHGVYRFDGTTWSHVLDGHCVHSIDVAPNGWVWLRAAPDLGDDGEGPVDLYAIRPGVPGA